MIDDVLFSAEKRDADCSQSGDVTGTAGARCGVCPAPRDELAAAGSLNAGNLGKQMAVAEVSHAISSRALLTVRGSQMRRSALQWDLAHDERFFDLPTRGAVCHGRKDTVPAVVKEEPATSPDMRVASGGPPFEETGDSPSATLEEMLHEASEVRSNRLEWIFCALFCVMLSLFYSSNVKFLSIMRENVARSEGKLARVSASTAANQVEWLRRTLINALQLFELTRNVSLDSSMNVTHDSLCRSVGGAPLLFATYDSTGTTLVRRYTCPFATDKKIDLPASLRPMDGLVSGPLRMAVYRSDFIIALISSVHNSELLAVLLRKEVVARLIFANFNQVNSSSTIKQGTAAIFLPEFTTLKPVVAVHTLNDGYGNSSVMRQTPLGSNFQDTFANVCASETEYTWYTLMHPVFNGSCTCEHGAIDIYNNFLGLYIDKRSQEGVLRVITCGVMCSETVADHCGPGNPTNTWFVAEDEALEEGPEVFLTRLAILVCFVLFLSMAMVVYLGVVIPAQHLKLLIFNTFGIKRVKTDRERLLFRYTRDYWPGCIQTLVKMSQVLLFFFRLGKKYVPQHVFGQQVLALRDSKDDVWRTIVEKKDTDDGEPDEGDDDTAANDQEAVKAFVKTVSKGEHVSDVRMLNVPRALSRRENGAHYRTLSEGDSCERNFNFVTGHNNINVGKHGMTLVEGATILAVHLCAVEMAYFTNYRVAVKKHRYIMNLLLGHIRHYRGELFERSGDCIAAAWNAFESRVDHASRAALCALSIARFLEQHRQTGFRVGIVLHQGSFVSGVVEDNKEAFTTVFGAVPRQAVALAELAASLPFFHVLVSEPVKQSLASLYECIIVDVIKYHKNDNPIVMFELREERRLLSVKRTPPTPSAFAEEHARVFFDFRNHDFERALTGIEQLRHRFPESSPQLLRRLELLCKFYMHSDQELPMPYFRPYPTWPNYEAIANVDYILDAGVDDSREGAHSDNLSLDRTVKAIYEDDTARFRQELHDNVLASKRTQHTGSPAAAADGDNSKAAPTGNRASSRWALTANPTHSARPPSRSTANVPADEGEAGERRQRGASLTHVTSRRQSPRRRRNSVRWAQDAAEEPESALSVRTVATATADDDDRDSEFVDGAGRERLSFANSLGSVFVDGRSRSFLYGADSLISFGSEAAQNTTSASFGDLDRSFSKIGGELPQTIVAKNGIEYIRSSRILGMGSFGCVYLGMETLSGRLVAIKFLPLPSDEEEIAKVEREVVTMQKVKSNYVVEFISYGFQNNLIIIVMECMMAGSLQGLISGFRNFHSATARLFIRDVLRGLHKLHSMGIIHRDVKPKNVLHALAGNCKISDFGASVFLQELVRKQMEGKGLQVQGTPVYLAPEAARGKPEEKSDIWSCGIMFIQLVTGRLPYTDQFLQMPPQILVYRIGSGAAKPIIPESLDAFDADFVRHCLKDDPAQRFSAERLLELPLFGL